MFIVVIYKNISIIKRMNKINFLVIGSKCASKEIITNTFSKTPKASETIMDVNINIFEDDQIALKVFDVDLTSVC